MKKALLKGRSEACVFSLSPFMFWIIPFAQEIMEKAAGSCTSDPRTSLLKRRYVG
jgi:hypothetical protein